MASDELAEVHYLPTHDVIDAEIVKMPSPRRLVVHPKAKTAGLHVAYVGGGVKVIAQRWWQARNRAARQARLAELANNREDVKYWHEQDEQAKASRHRRLMDKLEVPFRLVKVVGLGLGCTFGGLLILGICLWLAGQAEPFDPIIGFAKFIAFLWWMVTAFWVVLAGIAVAFLVMTLHRAGRAADAAPAWLAPQTVTAPVDTEITPSRVVMAFRECGIAPLRKAIAEMEDAGAAMLSPIVIAGCGIEVDVTPPPVGVTTLDLIDRRRKLAENIDRHEHEVHLRVAPNRPRTVRMWVADSGALDEPIASSPMISNPSLKADYKRGGAPLGVNLRGDALPLKLHQRHVLVAGMSNQGKTKTMRALALWLALDPNVELWIADLKGYNDETGESDWEMFRDIATRFVAGPTDDHVVSAVEMLEDAVVEMNRRLTQGGKYRPRVCIVDEVQKMYMCPTKDASGRPYGGRSATSRGLTAVRELHNQGRVVDMPLWEGTQDPSNDNYPVLARNGIHLRICTAISTQSQSRMVLQDKAVDAGAAPDKLRLGQDKGTVVIAGDGAPLADGEIFTTMRVHYTDDKDAWTIAERALALRGPVVPADPDEVRDLMQDVHEAFGSNEFVKATDMVSLLRDLAPHYRPYRSLNGKGLAEWLGREGVEVKDKDGVLTVRAERVLRALDMRQGVE